MSAPLQSALQADAEARLLFEMLLADVCAEFVNVAPNDIDSKIASAQRAICESLKVGHSSVWQVSDENPDMPVMTHVYRDPSLKPLPSRPNVKEYFPWSSSKILKKEIVCVPNTATLPLEAATDKKSWEEFGVHSSLVIPLSVGGGPLIGVLAFDSEQEREWPEPLQRRLQILAHVFAQALDRKNADRKLRESEVRRKRHEEKLREYERAIENAEEMIAVVDCEYRFLIANRQFLKLRNKTQEQVIGHFAKDVLKEGVFEALVKPKLDECFQGKVVRYEMKYTYPELGERDMLVSYFPIDGADGIDRVACILQDITERKRAEQELATASQRLRLAIESASIGGWDYNLKTGKKVWFGGTHAQLGMAPDETPGSFEESWDRIHKDDCEHLQHALREARDKHEQFTEEFRVVWRDGTTRWLRSRGRFFYAANGEPERLLGLSVDITQSKQAEQALREMNRALEEKTALLQSREELLKTFVKNVPVAVAMLDRELRYLQVSDRWCSDNSVEASALLGRLREELPEMPERWKEVNRRALQGETLRADEERWESGGSTRWARWEVRPWRNSDNTVGGILVFAEDITDRKRAEEAVKESETRFRLVADTAPVMIWMSGVDRKPTYFNQPWLDFTGFSETDLQNRLAEIVHPDDYPQCHEVYCRGFDERQPFRKECRLRRHDGQYRWMLDIGVPRFHKDGSFAGYIGSCIDVTDQKLAEGAISSMTRKLVEAQEQERARIARELHDDINQRLAMLAVELEQLQDDPFEVRSRVPELRKQTTEISNDVQALSRDLHSSQLEYLGAVAGMKSWCKEFAERQGMQIDYRLDVQSTLPREIGLCLFRVLQEALHNANKHSGVKRVEVQLREDSGEIHLTIRDLGKGFDVETAKQGRGLGLTSMRERIRLVNGTIDIQSKPMGGTTIHVRVPLDSERGTQRLAV